MYRFPNRRRTVAWPTHTTDRREPGSSRGSPWMAGSSRFEAQPNAREKSAAAFSMRSMRGEDIAAGRFRRPHRPAGCGERRSCARCPAGGLSLARHAVALSLALLSSACFGIGRKPVGEVYLAPEAPDAGPDFANALYQTTGVRLQTGNSVDFINNGKVFEAILAEIAGARRSIHIVTFIWSEGEVSDRVIEAIAARTRAGVACRILVDAVGSLSFGDGKAAPLVKAGCDVRRFRPVPGQDDLARKCLLPALGADPPATRAQGARRRRRPHPGGRGQDRYRPVPRAAARADGSADRGRRPRLRVRADHDARQDDAGGPQPGRRGLVQPRSTLPQQDGRRSAGR